MNEKPINRRQAIGGIGAISLGALLSACGADSAPTSTTTTAQVETTGGSITTVETSSGNDLTALFGEESSCTLTPEMTEGPFYFDADAIRSDIREDREGARLRLAIRVRDAASCEPLRNAVVEIWHCDAGGAYSGFEASTGARFLRGAQVTDSDGIVEFTTIYPGWYQGRTVHIHAKVHPDNATVLTTQLYFDDSFSDDVFADAPYSDQGQRTTFNESDGIYDPTTLLDLRADGDGFLGTISIDAA